MKKKLKMIWRILWAKRWFAMTESNGKWKYEFNATKNLPSQALAEVYAEIAVISHNNLGNLLKGIGKKISTAGMSFEEKPKYYPTLLYFRAEWAVPSLEMDKVLKNNNIDAEIIELDIDKEENKPLRNKFNIHVVPTLILKWHGVCVGRKEGQCSAEELNKWIDTTIKRSMI